MTIKIKVIQVDEIPLSILNEKSDLADKHATYLAAFLKGDCVGIAGYQEHDNYFYLCHDYVPEKHRMLGIYKLLWEARESHLSILNPKKELVAHCNQKSLMTFMKGGFEMEYVLFKVIKKRK